MGIRIVVKNADFSQNAVGYLTPVQEGLEYLNFFGGTAALGRNLAMGKPAASVVGKPTVGLHSAMFNQLTDYLQTAVADTVSKTIMVVGRSPDPKGEGVLVSNYNSARMGASLITAGSSLMFRANADPDAGETGEVLIASAWDGSTHASVDSGGATLLNRPIGGIQTLIGRTNSGNGALASAKTRRIDNKTVGLSVTTSFTNKVFDIGQAFRIGSGYTAITPSSVTEIFFVAIWNRPLLEDEVEAMTTAVKAYYSKRGIVV